MQTTLTLYRLHESGRVRRAFQTLGLEIRTLLGALLSPNKIIEEVKAMHALQVEATRIEAAEPERAAMLRRQAARMVL